MLNSKEEKEFDFLSGHFVMIKRHTFQQKNYKACKDTRKYRPFREKRN